MVLGGIFAIIVVVIGVAAAIFIPRGIKLDHEAVAYIRDVVPAIAASADGQALVERATPTLAAALRSGSELDKLSAAFRELGTLKHLDDLKGRVSTTTVSGDGIQTFGIYTAQAEFEEGHASVRILLQRVDGTWRIDGFHVNSHVLVQPPSGSPLQPTRAPTVNRRRLILTRLFPAAPSVNHFRNCSHA